MIHSIKRRIFKNIFPNAQMSYAQNGEDLILAHYFFKHGIEKPTYLDIGANHPRFISNTYFFYLKGGSGVCVEPNPKLARKFSKVRTRDKVLNVGVGIDDRKEADFYQFPDAAHGLSTFSKEDAEYWSRVGMKGVGKIKYEKVVRVPLIQVNEILENHFEKSPDILSIDVEGLDLEILKTIDFTRFKPLTIIVETLLYDEMQRESRNEKIIDFLTSLGYTIYADTHVNTIFLRN
jgi:FkbM family methyltransferase